MKIKEHILPVLIAVAILAVVGGIFWGVLKTPSQDQVPQESENNQNNESPSPDPALTQQTPSQLPAGYDTLVDNNPTMREDLEKNLRNKFDWTIKSLKADTSNSLLWSDLGSIKYAFED